MRKLIERDLTAIIGTTISGYELGRNPNGNYVTWQFHLDENENPSVYWGHYLTDNRDCAIHDFNTRS